jgi:hypothetical protein
MGTLFDSSMPVLSLGALHHRKQARKESGSSQKTVADRDNE